VRTVIPAFALCQIDISHRLIKRIYDGDGAGRLPNGKKPADGQEERVLHRRICTEIGTDHEGASLAVSVFSN